MERIFMRQTRTTTDAFKAPGLTQALFRPHRIRSSPKKTLLPTGEWLNTLSHGAAALLSIPATVFLLRQAAAHGDGRALIGSGVFGLTLTITYAVSCLYHACADPRAKASLRRADHAAIFLLIAGTYTPFCLALPVSWSTPSLIGIWTLALVGMVFKAFRPLGRTWLSLIPYIGVGWLVACAAMPIIQHLGFSTFAWLFAGGCFYTLGTLFYLRSAKPYMHAVWHGFVILGSVSHYVAVVQLPGT
ncbi:hemolysin III family protein [Pseudoxanthomonas winnipegensis]|uniref:PAQR family membrane homeostasis protein TrhA n=1 Tax=Pseudoxanthomonas winnipegensis TaxID=2480810 RepID=UPI002574FDAA|nr:hemolysin III family protein [Pseudoxanthomonas winnipegensis]WJI16585.1 hemolysin III family protein [Pseudoxanthomonas winnipegensis]